MNYKEMYESMCREYPQDTSLHATLCLAILLSMKDKPKDYLVPGTHTRRWHAKCKNTLWELEEAEMDLVFRLAHANYVYTITQTCTGLGGCVAMTYKQVIEDELDTLTKTLRGPE